MLGKSGDAGVEHGHGAYLRRVGFKVVNALLTLGGGVVKPSGRELLSAPSP